MGYADTGAARFLRRRPAIYSGLTPPSNSACNRMWSSSSKKLMNWLTNCGKTRADREEPRAGTRAWLDLALLQPPCTCAEGGHLQIHRISSVR
jgi:hypothetical protein